MIMDTAEELSTVQSLFQQAITQTLKLVAAGEDYTTAQLILEAGKPEAGRLGKKLPGYKRDLRDWEIACEVQEIAPTAIEGFNAELSEHRESLRAHGYDVQYRVSDMGGVRAMLVPLEDNLPEIQDLNGPIVSRFG